METIDAPPLTEPTPKKLWRVLGLVGLVCVVLVGLNIWLGKYLNSDEFKRELEERLSEKLQAKVVLVGMRYESGTVRCSEMHARGGTKAHFGVLDANAIELSLDVNLLSALSKKCNIGPMSVGNVTIDLGAERLPQDFPSPDRESEAQISKLTLNSVNLVWPGGSLSDARLELNPTAQGWQLLAQKGLVKHGSYPSAELTDLRAVIESGAARLENARIAVEGGTVEFIEDLNDLRVLVDKVNVKNFLPKDWRASLHGKCSGQGKWIISSAKPNFSGSFRFEDSKLEALPILNAFATVLRTEEMRKLSFSPVSFDLYADALETRVKNIAAISGQLVGLRGELTSQSGAVHGDLVLGISPKAVEWMPWLRESIFKLEQDGFIWAPIQISGSPSNLQEDLTPKIVELAKEAGKKAGSVGTQAVEVGKGLLQEGLNQLLKP